MDVRQAGSVTQLGGAVYDARTQAGMTQKELAQRAGVSMRWLGTLERGDHLGLEYTRVCRVLDELGLQLQVAPKPPMSDTESAVWELLQEQSR
jgi:transcriptional regulator with XRE-family HTH domain